MDEINREVIRTIYKSAEAGAQLNTATAGQFDLDIDSNGRWSVEKFKGLLFQIERDANQIAQRTRRGKGNIILTSADVASALTMDLVYLITPLPLTPTLTLTTLATPLLVLSTVSIASTSIPSLPTTLHSSTTLLVIRVPHLMTLVCSTAPTYLSRWSVPLVRTPSRSQDRIQDSLRHGRQSLR